MMRKTVTAFLSLIACSWAFAADGEQIQSLQGPWQFTIDEAVAANPAGNWDSITVPGNWDTLETYAFHRGKGWYMRKFTVPSEWQGKQLRLRFEAVYHAAEVTLNGKPLGQHVGGYTPFEFDVTKNVNYGGENTVVVCADNTYRRGAWWAWGGISRDVKLIANNDARIVWQHIRAEPDLVGGSAKIFVRYNLLNAGAQPLTVSLSSSINGVANPRLAKSVLIPAGGNSLVELDCTLLREEVKLWHFEHPNLYQFDTVLAGDNNQVLHTKHDRFGIRKVEITAEGLFLNGEQIRVPGFNRVAGHPVYGNTEPDVLVKADVDSMKSCGAVFSRLMHYPQATNLLDYLDEKGMMIFEEIPVWGGDDPQVKNDNPLTKQWLREMIERDYNHPCIIGWSPGNELHGHDKYVRSMFKYIRAELDPHRLVSYASFTAASPEYGPHNDPATDADLIFINRYNENGGSAPTLRNRWPDKAIFYTELGTRQFGENLDAKIPGIEKSWRGIVKDHPYVIGMSLWTYNDYRNAWYKPDKPDSKEKTVRSWGIVDVNRNAKAAWQQVRDLFCPVRSLTVSDNKIIVTPRGRDEVPSYTLRGYKIKYTLLDAGNQVIKEAEISLPDIKPDDAEWSASIPDVGQASAVKVELVTPTGYQVQSAVGKRS